MADAAFDAQRRKDSGIGCPIAVTPGILEVRLSHLLRDCSVGAVVRDQDLMLAVQDTRSWYRNGRPPPGSEVRHVDQVRAALDITERLFSPPPSSVSDTGKVQGPAIPAVRFPEWMRCPAHNCGLLYNRPWQSRAAEDRLTCTGREAQPCGRELEQVPWVVAHEEGYLADVPWHDIAHRNGDPDGSAARCPRDWERPYLRLVEADAGRRVECTRCKSSGKLPQRLKFPRGARMQPWVREVPATQPEEPAWLLEVNDVRVHAAWTTSAIVIPPESRIRKGTVVDRMYGNSQVLDELKGAGAGLRRKQLLKRYAREFRCPEHQVEDALRQIREGYPHLEPSPRKEGLERQEYGALIKVIEDFREDEDFVTEHRTEAWKQAGRSLGGDTGQVADVVEQLVAVRRLKEILVLRGFGRLGAEQPVPPDLTGQTGWLPALALRGEGIFFVLSERTLEAWENQAPLQARAKALQRRYTAHPARAFSGDFSVSPRFLLLHTLAHCLIRQLESAAGYPAASLRERLYCSPGPQPMAGILVYVAVPDAVGSLGGLVDLAEPRRFLRYLLGAFDAAKWCSLDPICAKHEGQGPGLLNAAACQACSLLPEPSCPYGNILLDRTFVKGDRKQGIRGLLACSKGPQ